MEDSTMQIQPGRSVGFMTLGSSLHEVLTTIMADVKGFRNIEVTHDDVDPLGTPFLITLADRGLRLRFDGPDQRLRLIEVTDFTKTTLVYKDVEVFKPADGHGGVSTGPIGPKFRHVYDRLLGPTYGGEYLPPETTAPNNAAGTYNLSYPGIAFNFPLRHSAWSPKKNFISLLSSSAAGPATSMAVFSGESWQKARGTLFTAPPPGPRMASLASKGREAGIDEIELARAHGEGRIELVRRTSPPFWLILSETTPQDLIMELGPPDAIYYKNDHRLSIHKDRRASDVSDNSAASLASPGDREIETGAAALDDDDAWEDEDDEAEEEARERETAAAEHFYNYFHHGFDILISQPTHISPPFPGSESEDQELHGRGEASAQPSNHLTATKIILHGNVPGSYQFNRHRRSRWTIENVTDENPPTSETPFSDISSRLRKAFKSYYATPDIERQQQRGMALNRGWGNSPGSSIELLGEWDDPTKKSKSAASEADHGSTVPDGNGEIGNVMLYGFPGLVFEVLKNGAVSNLMVY